MRHIVVICFVIIGHPAVSQIKENVVVRKYTQKDGITSFNIRRVTEDSYGFVWIATQDGLNRFDGRNFTQYTKGEVPDHRICGIDIRELIPDSATRLLWVLPGEVGVNAINTLTGAVVKTIPIPPASKEDWNICMAKAGHFLWIGTFSGLKVYNIDSSRFEPLPTLKPMGSGSVEFEVRSVLQDHNGNMWVAYTGHGIVVYDGKTRAVLRTVPIAALNDFVGSHAIRFLRSIEPARGSVLFATNQGLRRIGFDDLYSLSIDNHPCGVLPALDTEPLEYVALQKGAILLAGPRGLLRLNSSLSQYIQLDEHSNATDNKWLPTVQCIFADNKDNLWLGCQEGLGFIAGGKSPFTPYVYDERSNIKLDHVRSIYPLPDGDILAGLWYGLVRIDHTTGAFSITDKPHTYQHLFQDKAGRIIASRPDGLFILDNTGTHPLSTIYPEFKAWPGVYINSHIVVNDTLTLLGTESNTGVLCWDPVHGRIDHLGKNPGILSSNVVNNIYRDSLHRLWVLSDYTIDILSPDLRTCRELTLPYNLFFNMCEAAGHYWIASYGGGLIQLDSALTVRRVVNTGAGLTNDGVYQLYNIDNRQLLVTTNNGISVVDLSDYRCQNFSSTDGLHSNAFEEVCGMRKNGYIYAGGLNGFTVIDPRQFAKDTTPPAFFFQSVHTQTKSRLLDTTNLQLTELTIPNDWLQTEISFAGLYYTGPAAVRYQYRILEQDTVWLQPQRQASLTLTGIAPGSYTLEARAANKDGYWSPSARLRLTFLPKWYETLLFRLAIFLLAAIILYLIYRVRVNEIRKQQQIRTGIASDLHDDIGSLLNSVKVFSHLAKKDPASDEHFRNIDETLSQANTGLRDMIWVLDNSDDTIGELMDRIKKYALPIATACEVRLDYAYTMPEKQTRLSKTEKRNLLLIAKEAINNSIKYSCCRMISISCSEDRSGFALKISDDGKGFDLRQPVSGNGLRNMKTRALQIRCEFQQTSVAGSGTSILISRK